MLILLSSEFLHLRSVRWILADLYSFYQIQNFCILSQFYSHFIKRRIRAIKEIGTVAHKCNGETKSHGKTHFNSRHNKINLQSNETSRQNKINSRQNNINSRRNNINSRQNKISSRQNTINSRQNKISSRQNTINSRQNKNKLTAKYTLSHGKIESTHGKIKINSRQNTN